MEQKRTDNEDEGVDIRDGQVGDVETAGETTAAVAISGPADTRPVRPDLTIKVADAPAPNKEAEQGQPDEHAKTT